MPAVAAPSRASRRLATLDGPENRRHPSHEPPQRAHGTFARKGERLSGLDLPMGPPWRGPSQVAPLVADQSVIAAGPRDELVPGDVERDGNGGGDHDPSE